MPLTESTSASRRTLRRVFQMPLPELVSRGRQETFKWVDRLRPTRTPSAAAMDLDGFLRNAQKHFFAGAFDADLASVLQEDVLAAANEILRGRFDLLGYRDLDLGVRPDWHRDAISGRRVQLVHWSRIDPTDHAVAGDSKVVWELNRHQWLVRLGQAYRLTKDERYAEVAIGHLLDWIAANPRGMGINWASSLEVAFRLIAWCWTLLLVRDSAHFTRPVLAKILAAAKEHGRHIERYLSSYFSPNTHLTGEALGLFYAGIVFSQLDRAARWRSLAKEILVEQIEKQVLRDGVYFERTTCYQRYTIDIYLHFMILAARIGIEIPAAVGRSVTSMLDVLIALRNPDGSMPSIGDADGGVLLPLSARRPDDYRATFSNAAVVFQRPEYAWAAGTISDETLWLFGSTAASRFAGLNPMPPAGDPCRLFADGGFAVMRSGWDADAHSLIFDAGPLGCTNSSGHGHADLLSIQCSAFGKQYIVDAGTGSYADSVFRNYFRSTAAHNTVMIDGKGQTEPAGPFSWSTRVEARLTEWQSTGLMASADADHRSFAGVKHRRRVIFVKSGYWVVIDDLTGADVHRVELRYQLAPIRVRVDQGGWTRAIRDRGNALLIRAFSDAPLKLEVREGRREPMEGWVSPDYGQLVPAPMLVYTANAQLPLRITTLLCPARDAEETPCIPFDDLSALID